MNAQNLVKNLSQILQITNKIEHIADPIGIGDWQQPLIIDSFLVAELSELLNTVEIINLSLSSDLEIEQLQKFLDSYSESIKKSYL
jgi:hypothetical protein